MELPFPKTDIFWTNFNNFSQKAIREQFDLEKGALTNRIQEIEKDSQHQLQEVKKENEDLSCKVRVNFPFPLIQFLCQFNS